MPKTERIATPFFDCNWKILDERVAPDGSKLMRVGGRFQHAERRNGNGRVYPLKLFEKMFSDEDVINKVKHRRMLGELEHPADGTTNLNRVSHLITKVELREDGEVYGECELFNTPAGQIAQELFRHGVTVGISSRGRGSSYTRTGNDGQNEEVVDDDYVLETFDLVYNPSTPDAFLSRLESLRESLSPEAVKYLQFLTESVDVRKSEGDSQQPSKPVKRDMKQFQERLKVIGQRASDVLNLLAKCESSELDRYEDDILNMMVEAEDMLLQNPALRPLVEHEKRKLEEAKTAIDGRRDGTERTLNEEVSKILGGSEEITENKKPKTGDVEMITVPAELFRRLAESNTSKQNRIRDLTERQTTFSENFVSRSRYETAIRLCDTVLRKGRMFREGMDKALLDSRAVTELLEQFISVTDRRQVKQETARIVRRFPHLASFKESLLESVSARHVRQQANSLLRGLAGSTGKQPVKKPIAEGRRRPDKPPVRLPNQEIVEGQEDRGLAVAERAATKLGWKR